jgi:protein TonB
MSPWRANLPRRRTIAAWVAISVHALVLLPLLVNAPAPLPTAGQAIMVGVTVAAPAVQATVPAAATAPAAPAHAPQRVATHAPPNERSIAIAAAAPAEARAQASAAATEAAASSTPAESGSAIEAPRYQAAYLNNPQPPYPAMSRKQREEGTVRLHVMVDVNGRAETVKVKTSSGHERLDMAARAAVQEWRFVPARQRGENIAGWVEVPVQFQLEK